MIPVFLAESSASVLLVILTVSEVTSELSPAAYKPKETLNDVVPIPVEFTYPVRVPLSPGP